MSRVNVPVSPSNIGRGPKSSRRTTKASFTFIDVGYTGVHTEGVYSKTSPSRTPMREVDTTGFG